MSFGSTLYPALRIVAYTRSLSLEGVIEYRISLTATYPSKLNQSLLCSIEHLRARSRRSLSQPRVVLLRLIQSARISLSIVVIAFSCIFVIFVERITCM
jgi:hypothetical protein